MCCEGEALSSTPFLLGWSLKIRKPAEEETGFHAKSFVVLTLFLEVHFPKVKPEVTRALRRFRILSPFRLGV